MRTNTFILLALFLASMPALAESLAERKVQKQIDETLAEEGKTAMAPCGDKIALPKIKLSEWKAEDGKHDDWQRRVRNWCINALEGVAKVCATGKDDLEAVQKQITSVACEYDGAMTTETFAAKGVKIDGKKLRIRYNLNVGNVSDSVKDRLAAIL